jgi:hypothetical protein
MVVQADDQALVKQGERALLLIGGQAGLIGRHPAEFWRELEGPEILPRR